MKKAVFFDIDGTLIDGSTGMRNMSEKTKEAIKKLQAAGHYVLIASGRPKAFLDKQILEFGFDGFVLMNGANVTLHDTLIFEQTLPKEYIDRVCKVCERNNVGYVLEGVNHVYLKKYFHDMHAHLQFFGIAKDDFVYEYNPMEIDVYKIEMIALDQRANDACMSLVIPGMDYFKDPRLGNHFELYSKTVTKATGILKVLSYLNIPVEQSYAFGDGKNDIEMLQTVGCSFAMDNALAEVKKVAHHVVPSVHEDGVAFGIETYILG